MLHPTDMIAHTMAFVTPFVEHWLEREIARLVVRSLVNTKHFKNEQVVGHHPKGQTQPKVTRRCHITFSKEASDVVSALSMSIRFNVHTKSKLL